MADGALDPVAIAVKSGVKGMGSLARRIVGNDRQGAALCQILPQRTGVVSGIGEEDAAGRHLLQQRNGNAHIAVLAGRELERDRPTATVGQ